MRDGAGGPQKGVRAVAYRVSKDEKTRAQILWVALAIAVSITPFIFLYQLPTALGLATPLSEEAATLLFPAAPAGFAVAILRYRLMDITVVVNRGLVYSLTPRLEEHGVPWYKQPAALGVVVLIAAVRSARSLPRAPDSNGPLQSACLRP